MKSANYVPKAPHITLMRLIKQEGLKSKDVAEGSGIHRVILSAILRSRVPCNELQARRLADFFGVDWRELITK